ncbi:MAG: DUF4258 domain-containing protein [Candidatus Pacebacteria bacterium]|nr:DUF4258 domain-containing protein [Candidatus Paceibacterota bacterium]
MGETYKNLVFTKHAGERVQDRSLTKDMVYQAISFPDKTYHNQDNYKFIRTIGDRKIHVVATPIENNRYLVISTWVRGEDDREPLVWQLLTLPFKIIWWILKTIGSTLIKK